MKKNGIVLAIIMIASIIGAYIVRNTFFEETTIKNDTTIETLQKETVIIENFLTEDDFSKEELETFVERESKTALDSEYVFKVSPTGNLHFNNSVIMQEVLIERVIVGSCKEEKIWICCNGSILVNKEDNTYSIEGLEYSLMQPEYEYLVFCIPSEVNTYTKENIYHIDDSLWFSYYNITKDSEKIMENVYYDKELELYTDSNRLLGYFNELKTKIFELFEIHFED